MEVSKFHIVESQLAQLRYLRLDEERATLRVESAGQVIQGYLYHVLAHLFGCLHVVGQSLGIGYEHEHLLVVARVLQFYAATQRAHIVPDVQTARGTVAGEDNLFFTHISIISTY